MPSQVSLIPKTRTMQWSRMPRHQQLQANHNRRSLLTKTNSNSNLYTTSSNINCKCRKMRIATAVVGTIRGCRILRMDKWRLLVIEVGDLQLDGEQWKMLLKIASLVILCSIMRNQTLYQIMRSRLAFLPSIQFRRQPIWTRTTLFYPTTVANHPSRIPKTYPKYQEFPHQLGNSSNPILLTWICKVRVWETLRWISSKPTVIRNNSDLSTLQITALSSYHLV